MPGNVKLTLRGRERQERMKQNEEDRRKQRQKKSAQRERERERGTMGPLERGRTQVREAHGSLNGSEPERGVRKEKTGQGPNGAVGGTLCSAPLHSGHRVGASKGPLATHTTHTTHTPPHTGHTHTILVLHSRAHTHTHTETNSSRPENADQPREKGKASREVNRKGRSLPCASLALSRCPSVCLSVSLAPSHTQSQAPEKGRRRRQRKRGCSYSMAADPGPTQLPPPGPARLFCCQGRPLSAPVTPTHPQTSLSSSLGELP